VRRRGRNTGAARAASGKGAIAARDPNRVPCLSKPDAAAVNAGPDLAPELTWAPAHALAPGLHLVATPIGNLGDITLRALWVLRSVDRILCEDTRVTGRLLGHFGIHKPLDPYHDHNADRVRPQVLAALRRGETLALVSDAGTPLVSDPGYRLVREALAEGLPVTAAPGPSAAVTALILSGLPPDAFLFVGFLPPRSAARRKALAGWKDLAATLVFYEGPSRLAACLGDMAAVLGDRPAAVVRELTKRHEEMQRGTLVALAAHYRDASAPRGEIVIVVGPPLAVAPETADLDVRLGELLSGRSLRDAVAELAAETGLGRKALYDRALARRRQAKKK
jgi:16S rRNA (cytidine1402-2'-O)-methyltransferase